jgi:hypothetical protein
MEPPRYSLTAAELAAIEQLRKRPSWRATKVLNGIPTKRLWSGSEQLALWVTAGLIALVFLLGWLLCVH